MTTTDCHENKIALELMSIISKYLYRRYVSSSRDATSDEDFANKGLSTSHWIYKRQSYCGHNRNSEYIYELFSKFSVESARKVHEDIDLLHQVEMEKSLYLSVGRVLLNMRGCDIDMWLEDMSDVNHFPDELMIYALSRTYNQHVLIVCKECNWSTIESNVPLEEEELLVATHVKLIYLGSSVYSELKTKPYSQEVSNPITTLQLAAALSRIHG